MATRDVRIVPLVLVWLFLGFVFSPVSDAGDVREPMRILLAGDIFPCPVILLCVVDPAFDYTPIQTREIPHSEAQRYIRLYFPRTREELNEYSMLFFVDSDMSPFTVKQIADMVDSVREGWCGTFWTFGPHYGSVVACTLEQVVPHEMSMPFNQWAWSTAFYRVSFRRGMPPVFTPFVDLGVENVQAYGCGQIVPRSGTLIWGDLVPFGWPWMVSWRFGENGGICWVAADDLDHPFWSRETYGFCHNLYSIDILANIVTYSVGRELPGDIMVPIHIRREFLEYHQARGLFVSILEFAEKFGADTSRLYGEMLEIDRGVVRRARDGYLDGQYDEALADIRVGNQLVRDLCERGLKARERALFWIFLVEWFVVSGTSMVSGFVLWTLMIRRRIYREVGTTRLLGA